MSATISSLRIRNLALVEDITWEPSPGFVAITGETGAGKSIIIGAIKLLLGERADRSLIRAGAETCTVESAISLPGDSPAHGVLAENGLEPCEDGQLLLRRVIAASGTSKQFVNSSATTLATLKRLGDLLVDLHGPHDHQSLFSRDEQTRLLDSFGGSSTAHSDYAAKRTALLSLRRERDEMAQGQQALAREIDLLAHQVDEIAAANLESGEEEPLLARQRAASNARRLAELSAAACAGISGEDASAIALLSGIARPLRELTRLDPRCEAFAGRNARAIEELETLRGELESYAAGLDADPASVAGLDARIDIIQTLKRKYGDSVDAILAYGEDAASRLASMRDREVRGADLDTLIADAGRALLELGGKLSATRTRSAKKLADKVAKELGELGFKRAEFQIRLEPLPEPGPSGLELAEFLFAPNPGEPIQPLRQIASSGELSRVMLAVKTALTDQDQIPILIFDEIDANVGGEVATMVGRKMREIGRSHQVLCITHLPQVGAAGDSHFVVEKRVSDGRTFTDLLAVSGKDREHELARMLGGQATSAIAHAKALLAQP